MSIMGRRTGPAPEWQREFETFKQWAEHVEKKFFSALIHGQPFLLVIRHIEHDGTGHSIPETWVSEQFIVGFLSEQETLFKFNEAPDGSSYNADFTLGTREFISFPDVYRDGKMKSHVHGTLQIKHYDFHYTPVTAPFKPPFELGRSHDVFDQEVEAFSIACGVPAMEALAVETTLWDKRFLGWYARSTAQLHIAAQSEDISQQQSQEKVALIRRLREFHQNILDAETHIRRIHGSIGVPQLKNGALSIVTDKAFANIMSYDSRENIKKWVDAIKHNLTAAKLMGMLKDTDFLEVDGFRCQPAIVIEDFAKLYAVKL